MRGLRLVTRLFPVNRDSGSDSKNIANTLTNDLVAQINALNSILDAYNSSGDNVELDPSLPLTGKANRQDAKGIADI